MEHRNVIRVGSRKSELALIQTKHTISLLQKQNPHIKFEIHKMSTMGDRVLNISLPKIGEKSLFTKDLEESLRNGGVDLVVHSLKDLPTTLPLGMVIGAVLEREDPRDALVLRENYKQYTLETLPKGSIIGTSSLRRTAQLRRKYPQLIVCDIRGNLNTRLAKLDASDSKFAGIILAQAGLVRMNWLSRIDQVLEPVDLLYAVGQGALAVECRANDHEILSMLQKLICLETTCRILAERSFLKTLGGGCSAPVAVWSKLTTATGNASKTETTNHDNERDPKTGLSLVGAVWSLDGTTEIQEKKECSLLLSQQTKQPVVVRAKARVSNSAVDDDSSNGAPPCKRARESSSSSPELSERQHSPPVINDDAYLEEISAVYDVNELIEKHIDLAKKCPVIGVGPVVVAKAEVVNNNRNVSNQAHLGGGDAIDLNAVNNCPFPTNIGQDFMGECPFVSNETKIHLANAGKCPITSKNVKSSNNNMTNEIEHDKSTSTSASVNGKNAHCPFNVEIGQDFMGECPLVQNDNKPLLANAGKCPITTKNDNSNNVDNNNGHTDNSSNTIDTVDNAKPSSSSAAAKCPFNALHNTATNDFRNANNLVHGKCPFLQSVQMFDYSDEKMPKPQSVTPISIADVNDLFCGLYRHACFNAELYAKSDRLGRELAEELIKKGALDIMKHAQAEVHSKA